MYFDNSVLSCEVYMMDVLWMQLYKFQSTGKFLFSIDKEIFILKEEILKLHN